MSVSRARRTRRILFLVVAVLALLLVGQRLGLETYVRRCVEFFREAGAWPFFTAMAVLPAFGFPMWPFTVASGHVFGSSMGVGAVIACAILAQMANMTLCYWLAARVLRPWEERLVGWLGYSLPETPPGSAWEIILLVRIIPGPPFFLQNYLLGMARVPFGPYLVVSTLVHAMFVVGAIVAGDALTRGDPLALAFAGLVCAVGGFAIYRLRKRRSKSPPRT